LERGTNVSEKAAASNFRIED